MARLLVAFAVLGALVALPAATSGAQQAAIPNDINGDGAGDLLVGVPLEDVDGAEDAGSVNMILSDGDRLRAAGNRTLTQAGPLPDGVEVHDLFGSAVELVDINGDGFADAVIGSSGESHDLFLNAGSFSVVYGSESGLDTSSAVAYRQGTDGIPDAAGLDDFFGFNIASGDFNGDSYGDVAVSAPFDDVNATADAGGVTVVLGSADGLDTSTAAFFSQAGVVAGGLAEGDLLGWALTSGDFNGDTFDDLAVGTPGDNFRGRDDTGSVNVLYGSAAGITTDGNQIFRQGGRLAGKARAEDLFGFSVGSSDVDCDGVDDLLVGVPNDTSANVANAGAVNVILGSPSGLRKTGDVRLHQGQRRVAGPVGFNQFGAALAGGDFDGDGCGDVAIGAFTTDVGGSGNLCSAAQGCEFEAGEVVIVYGARSWPAPAGSARFSQAGEVAGAPNAGDFFGRTLAVVDIDGNGRDDLVVGVPGEDVAGRVDAGSIVVIEGSRRGLRSDRTYALSQRGRIKGAPERNDQFSSALFAGGT